VFEQPWLSEWDYLSRVSRVLLVLQIVLVAPALLVLGLVMAAVWHTWFGLVVAAFSVAWLCCQGISYRRLLQYRRAGG
jgi:polyferredoxin